MLKQTEEGCVSQTQGINNELCLPGFSVFFNVSMVILMEKEHMEKEECAE